MTNNKTLPLTVYAAIFSAGVIAAASSSNFSLLWSQLDSGGGSASSTNYALPSSAIGQAVSYSAASSTNYSLGAGFPVAGPDLDGDGSPDQFDSDIDGDLISNSWERDYGFNPYDPADGLLDSDNDGRSNADEFLDGGNPLVADTGDANSDGVSDISDLLMLERHVNNVELLDNSAQSRCDFDRDGEITVGDVLALQVLILQ